MKRNKCFLLLLTLLVAACSPSTIQKEIDVTTTEIEGENSELLSIVPGKYMLRGNKENADSILSMTIGLSIKETFPDKDVLSASLKLELLDEHGECVTESFFAEKEELVNFLNTKKVGKEKLFRFAPVLTSLVKVDELDDIVDKVQSIKVSTDVITLEEHKDPLPILNVSDISLPQYLRGKVEIVPDDNGKIPVGFNEYDTPEIEITFKLLKTVSTAPISTSYGQLWIIGLPKDKSGRTIREITPNYDEWRTRDIDGKNFKQFLESEPGETITMSFSGQRSNDYSSDYKATSKIASFKLNFSTLNN